MEDSLLRIPVVCPDCGREVLTEFPAASHEQDIPDLLKKSTLRQR
jgi:hypothetical protein